MAATRIPSGSICWQYTWKFTPQQNTFSTTSFIGVPNNSIMQQAYRLGAGTNTQNHLDRLCCYVNSIDLGKLGIRVRAVTCALQMPGSINIVDLWELDPIGDDQNSHVLFLCDVDGASSRPVSDEIALTFNLYLSGAVDHFVPERFDDRPFHSLYLNAFQNPRRGDVVFKMGNDSLTDHSAHKFILVARSPVLKALFEDDSKPESHSLQVRLIKDTDGETLHEFLHFLHTGTLTKPVTQQLAVLAEKYQVETLKSICRAVNARETALKMGLLTLAASTKLRSSQDHRKQQTFHSSATVVQLSTQTYTVQNISKQINKDAQWILDDVLLYKVENVNDNCKIIFYSDWMNDTMARRVSGVDLQVYKNDKIVRRCTMSPVVSLDSSEHQPLQVFTTGLGLLDCNDESSAFHFIVHYCLPSEGSKIQLRDSRLDQEIWSSAVNKEWTDVEFQVGGKAFPAHKALLAACCPALAALIPAESSTSAPHKVPIPNMDPDVFEVLLFYLYTGTIKTSSTPSGGLLKAAQTFSIAALVNFCSRAQQHLNQNEFSDAIMSLV